MWSNFRAIFPPRCRTRRWSGRRLPRGFSIYIRRASTWRPDGLLSRPSLRRTGRNPGKKHFPPVEIGGALLLKPSWSRRKPRPGQLELVLDPGLSFGTGHHATTGFCLRQLVKHRPRSEPRSLLDIGMGSGILAIAGAKLGYAPVEAFDFDPESLRVARANAVINGVAESVRLRRQDLGRLPLACRQRYDLVCANLEFDLLVRETRRILNRLKRGGVLVLAGILDRQFAAVRSTYEKSGLVMMASRGQGEWRSGAFRSVRPERR